MLTHSRGYHFAKLRLLVRDTTTAHIVNCIILIEEGKPTKVRVKTNKGKGGKTSKVEETQQRQKGSYRSDVSSDR